MGDFPFFFFTCLTFPPSFSSPPSPQPSFASFDGWGQDVKGFGDYLEGKYSLALSLSISFLHIHAFSASRYLLLSGCQGAWGLFVGKILYRSLSLPRCHLLFAVVFGNHSYPQLYLWEKPSQPPLRQHWHVCLGAIRPKGDPAQGCPLVFFLTRQPPFSFFPSPNNPASSHPLEIALIA